LEEIIEEEHFENFDQEIDVNQYQVLESVQLDEDHHIFISPMNKKILSFHNIMLSRPEHK
jgi:hypothetical protein